MSSDSFSANARVPGSPARRAFTIHPGSDLALVPCAIYVGTSGDVALRAIDSDEDVVYRNVPPGSYLTVRATAVRLAGTTAADLIGEV